MSAGKIINFFIFSAILNLLSSCSPKSGDFLKIDHVRFDPEKILITDRSGKKADLKSDGIKESIKIDTIGKGIYHLKFTISAVEPVSILNLEIPLQFMPDSAVIWEEVKNSFHWVPNLKKDPGDIFSQHVFRSPAIILTHKQSVLSVIPDLEEMRTYPETPYYLDLNFGSDGITISYGLSNYRTKQHVYYEHSDSSFILPDKITLGLYLISSDDSSPIGIVKQTNNSARTAYGLYLWGEEAKNKDWMDKALSTMNLLLISPRNNGFFKTIWVPEKNDWVASGQGGGPDLYHIPDNAWTAIWLLRFNDALKELKGANKFLLEFTYGLIETQQSNGSFPARIRVSDLKPDSVMINSTSGSMATWFLEEMILRKKLPPETEEKAISAVKKSLIFLEKEILPTMKFQDFEVFFSCAPNSLNSFDSLTWLYPHNTLSIQWSAEAFLKAYQLFDRKKDLDHGEYCLSLSLIQTLFFQSFIFKLFLLKPDHDKPKTICDQNVTRVSRYSFAAKIPLFS